MRVILAAVLILCVPSISRGQDIQTFEILHTQQTDNLALFEVAEPTYGEVVCGAHRAGRTVLWTSCHGPFASDIPFLCLVAPGRWSHSGRELREAADMVGWKPVIRVPSGPRITGEI